eukprot:TRINITY_DN699_c0_g1_i1.p1 TRINITY_DN699_c0_g1~~TRINITY_DN699_c0_g1_i1.p1  ORF type:complete len:295 (+),score=54.27 TRINITY_DN699_c0_g1_i1:189-1073(+)
MICLTCSGVHRSLGTHLSFVRSLTMDTWTEKQFNIMRVGGNGRFNAYMKEKGISEFTPIREKYNMKQVQAYKDRIKALSDELEPKDQGPTRRSASQSKQSQEQRPSKPRERESKSSDSSRTKSRSNPSSPTTHTQSHDFGEWQNVSEVSFTSQQIMTNTPTTSITTNTSVVTVTEKSSEDDNRTSTKEIKTVRQVTRVEEHNKPPKKNDLKNNSRSSSGSKDKKKSEDLLIDLLDFNDGTTPAPTTSLNSQAKNGWSFDSPLSTTTTKVETQTKNRDPLGSEEFTSGWFSVGGY